MLQVLDVQQAARIQVVVSGVLPDMTVLCALLLRGVQDRAQLGRLHPLQRTSSQESSNRLPGPEVCDAAEQADSHEQADQVCTVLPCSCCLMLLQ